MPTSTINANSAMRTAPASTIGEIGAGVGRPATTSASGESPRAFVSTRGPARRRSMTAAALDALSAGLTLLSVISDATNRPATHGRGSGGFPLNSRKFLGKDSQERLIGTPQI